MCFFLFRTIFTNGCFISVLVLVYVLVVNADELFQDQDNGGVQATKLVGEHNKFSSWGAIDHLKDRVQAEDLTVPYDADHSEVIVTQGERYNEHPKRRRLVRKRKRRPHVNHSEQQSNVSNDRIELQPYLREQEHFLDEHWEGEAFEEGYKRPYHKRRRQYPIYETEEGDAEELRSQPTEQDDEQGRKSQIQETFESTNFDNEENDYNLQTEQNNTKYKQKSYRKQYRGKTNESSNQVDLKTLLKQNDGSVSLLEILQQKNLSLTDLLKSKEKAIFALKEPAITERIDYQDEKSHNADTDYEDTTRYKFERPDRRRLPVLARLPKIKPSQDVENRQTTLKDHINAQRKRLSTLRSEKDNRIFSDVKHLDVVTEATTEKRIFIPSKYITKPPEDPSELDTTVVIHASSSTFLPTVLSVAETTKATTSAPSTSSQSPYINPSLIIKGNGIPVTRNRLALKPRLRLPVRINEKQHPAEAPKSAFSINIKDVMGLNNGTKGLEGPLKISVNVGEKEVPETTPNVDKENFIFSLPPSFSHRSPSAKDEIMEILKDKDRRVRLAKILESRNMTFAELVALRERGSSQVHLADIFHSQSKEPIPAEDDTIEAVNNRETKTEHPKSTQQDLSVRESRNVLVDNLEEKRQVYPSFRTTTYDLTDTENVPKTNTEFGDYNAPQFHNPQLDSENSYFNLNKPNNQNVVHLDEEEYMQLPSGVRSAIVVSTVIIASSISIFMSIFLLFKWQHKRRQRLSYTENTLNRGNLPILHHSLRSGKDLSPVMVNVTASSKNLLVNVDHDEQTIHQQYLWDTLQKPFQ